LYCGKKKHFAPHSLPPPPQMLSYRSYHIPLLFLNHDRRKSKFHQNRVHKKSRCATISIGEWMNVYKLVVSDSGKLDGMKFTGFLRIHPIKKIVHQNVNFLWSWGYVISDINLSSPKDTALDWINMTQNPLVYLKDVVE
jgi:hypothetical protein